MSVSHRPASHWGEKQIEIMGKGHGYLDKLSLTSISLSGVPETQVRQHKMGTDLSEYTQKTVNKYIRARG